MVCVFIMQTTFSPSFRVKKLKSTPIYGKPQMKSDAGHVMSVCWLEYVMIPER
jgi:hypothetical protein